MTDDPEIGLIKRCVEKIASVEEGWVLREKIGLVNFEVLDELEDPNASASFTVLPDGTLNLAVKRPLLDGGESWKLYNALTHELTHLTQQQDRTLSRFFMLNPDVEESAKMNWLIECDAYVKTQSIMEDLEAGGVVTRGGVTSFANQVADLYEQIKGIGHSHDDGSAQAMLFRSLVSNDQLAAAYVMPRLMSEMQIITGLNQQVHREAIPEGRLVVPQIWQGETGTTDIKATILGKVKSTNFMEDDDGKVENLESDSFLENQLPGNVIKEFKSICGDYKSAMTTLRPYLKPEAITQHGKGDAGAVERI